MLTHVEFKSDDFLPYDSEQYEVNAGRWGKRLADFLTSDLNQHGFRASQPIAEDWGWVVRIENNNFPLWIGCGNYGDDGFLCFIHPRKPKIWRWFRRVDTTEKVGE